MHQMRIARGAPSALILVMLAGRTASAQEVHGVVSDSATRRPLASAVLVLLDATGAALSRSITNERGQFRVMVTPAANRVRVLRLGYRAREVMVSRPGGSDMQLDINMLAIPTMLEPVTVVAAANCPRHADGPAALALLEQARVGLLATLVAREANPASIKLLGFERDWADKGDFIERQTVRIQFSRGRTRSYAASLTAGDFIRDGFSRDSAGMRVFFGPDAETLLDEGFASGYCFRLEDADRSRIGQVGLGFSAADRRTGRVDIDGALWIDTVAHALRDVTWRFTGFRRGFNEPQLGGSVSFREMPNGTVLIDRWHLRLSTTHQDTLYARQAIIRTWYSPHDVGGEVGRATWPDGKGWAAPLGALALHVVTEDGKPASGLLVRLAGTDYVATPDSLGNLEIRDVLPGPYQVVVSDTAEAADGITLGTPLRFVAQRDVVVRARLLVPPAEAFQKAKCSTTAEHHWVTVTVVRPDESPVVGAKWEVGNDLGSDREYVLASGRTGADGTLGFCSVHGKAQPRQLRISEGAPHRLERIVILAADISTVRVEWPARAVPE